MHIDLDASLLKLLGAPLNLFLALEHSSGEDTAGSSTPAQMEPVLAQRSVHGLALSLSVFGERAFLSASSFSAHLIELARAIVERRGARKGFEELLSSAESLARKSECRKALALLEKTVDIYKFFNLRE